MANTTVTSIPVIDANAMLEHWQGHRRLTRKVISAFPEAELFTHSVGGMRPFAELAFEMLRLAAGGIHGMVNGNWARAEQYNDGNITTKETLLKEWDAVTEELNTMFPLITAEGFRETVAPFGNKDWGGPAYTIIQYFVDNEVHHRGQGYVYLRSLGITPPGFWERW